MKGKGINAIGGKLEEEDDNSNALNSKSKKRNRDRLRNTKLKAAGTEKLPSSANNNSIKGARKGANGKPPANTDVTEEFGTACSFCGRFNHVDKDCYHKKIHFLETTAANAGVAGVPELKSPKVQAILSSPKKAVDNAAFVSAISQLAALHNQSSTPAKSVSWNTQE